MNILPAVKLASAAKNFLARLSSGAKKSAGVSDAKHGAGVSDTQSKAKNAQASSGVRKAQSVAGAAHARLLADKQHAPAFSDARDIRSVPNTPHAALLPKVRNAPDIAGARNNPAVSGARKAPSFSAVLRQAEEETQRGKSVYSRDIGERVQSLAQKQLHGGGRQTDNGARNAPSPHDMRARPADLTPAGSNRLQQAAGRPTETRQESPPEIPQRYTPLEKAPVVPHSANGVHYQLEEVVFTQRELAKLRDKLLREGLSPKSLTAIEQLASHPHGASLGQLLALINDKLPQKVALSDSEKTGLQNFADKIDGGGGGALGKHVLQLLENGRSKDAWDAITSSLADPDTQAPPAFEAWEAALVCKAFGISEGASLEILKSFGNADAMPLTSDVFTALMLPAQQEILDKTQQDDKLGPALAKHLQPIVSEARQRGEQERKAAEGTDRKSRQTEILIRDRFMASFHADVAEPERDDAGRNPLIDRQDASGGKKAAPDRKEAPDRKNGAGHNPPPIGRKNDARARQAETREMREALEMPADAPVPGRQAEHASMRAETRAGQADAPVRQPATQGARAEAPDMRTDTPRMRTEARAERIEAPDIQAKAPAGPEAPGRPEAQPGKSAVFAADTPPARENAPAARNRNQAAATVKMPEETPAPQKPVAGQDALRGAEAGEGQTRPQPPHNEHKRGDAGENNQDTRRDTRWEALLSRIEIRHNAHAADTHPASAFAMPAQPQEQSAGHISTPAPLIRQALQQADQGSLNKLANGEQRLELQLAPSELGAVTLILTSGKSGEINAIIRSERSETAELVARHLDMIRVGLEEQGLKVDKLEVQNQMLDNRDDWQGMEQHNAMREEQERREHLARLRRLGRQGGNEAIQARDVQLHDHTAKISGQGLHLVA